MDSPHENLQRDGFQRLPGLLPAALLRALQAGFSTAQWHRGGRRDALRVLPQARAVLALPALAAFLGTRPVVHRAILFDKGPSANWHVGWHQDLTIGVRERRPVAGFGPWSTKQGVACVRAPGAVLAGLLALRLHIDPCPAEAGALRVLPGSHLEGRLSPDPLRRLLAARASEAVCCEAEAGDGLVIRPLLVHSSRRATVPARRRVLHLELAVGELPGGLQWARA